MFNLLFGERKEGEEDKGKGKGKGKGKKRATANDIKIFAKTHNALVQSGKVKLPKPKKVK